MGPWSNVVQTSVELKYKMRHLSIFDNLICNILKIRFFLNKNLCISYGLQGFQSCHQEVNSAENAMGDELLKFALQYALL